ncbi:hypothetical protein BGZ65_001876 [Modicella reniformis]|uniref:Uncharacterized protein n=1 Tax=Modicella reniformis TaxID=1440133 RepID=A0A9P6MLP0_9FUNG|nr:hypothetical protein BGZ65_001876 [Modicella reniformis]
MFSKQDKRISLNPLDNRQYDADMTPIMTDFASPTTPTTPTTPRPVHNGGSEYRGNGGGGGRMMKSAPIQLPGNCGNEEEEGIKDRDLYHHLHVVMSLVAMAMVMMDMAMTGMVTNSNNNNNNLVAE